MASTKSNPGDKSKEEEALQEMETEHEVGRAQWSSPTEFLLTCIGYSVGLGNVWRFPYLCYKNGGGAFLIPYIIMMGLIGMPLLFMEYAFGQYFGVGGLTIFKKVSPVFQGIGFGYMTLNGLVCIYYNVIIAMSLYYLFASFTSELPWAHCGHEWNTDLCVDDRTNMTLFNITKSNDTKETSPSDEYFRHAVLAVKEGVHDINNLGEIRWHLCLCLLLAWILVIMFVSRGIKSTGKVAYFTATFPYLMLTVLVVRGVTLPGASIGIEYLFKPNFTLLTQAEVWYSAASQLFYSTNLAWGGMITMASYNTFHHNCFRDAMMVNIVSFCTSLYAGIAVFSIIGYMAQSNGVRIEDVIDSGPGLAFIAYPQALSMMPIAPLFSCLFFFMLFLLGIGSQMVGLETVMSGLCDEFPLLRQHRFKILLCVTTLFFFVGMAQVTQGGMYVLQLMDNYSASFSVLIIAIVECIAISWVYRFDGGTIIGPSTRFAANVKEMLDEYPKLWWRISWKYVSPIVITGILIFSFAKYERAKYGDYVYPPWAEFVGWIMVLTAILPIPIVGILKVYRASGDSISEKFANASKDTLVKSSIEVNGKRSSISYEEEENKKNHNVNAADDDIIKESDVLLSTEIELKQKDTTKTTSNHDV